MVPKCMKLIKSIVVLLLASLPVMGQVFAPSPINPYMRELLASSNAVQAVDRLGFSFTNGIVFHDALFRGLVLTNYIPTPVLEKPEKKEIKVLAQELIRGNRACRTPYEINIISYGDKEFVIVRSDGYDQPAIAITQIK